MEKEIVKKIIYSRRSIRKFKDIPVSDSDIKLLLQFGMSGPTACLKKPWKFYVVTNGDVLEKLKSVTKFSNMNAKCAIIVCGDLNKSLTKEPNDYWIQDCSAAIENILLGAEGIGLGGCWIGLYPVARAVKRMRNILNINDCNIVPLGMVYIGHKGEEKEPSTYYDENNVYYIK